MITTLEGTGKEDDPYREVHHIFDEDRLVGVIDTMSPHQPGRDLQNAINN